MKAGRVAGAILIILTGLALLLDLIQGTSYLLALVKWWPVALVLLGMEYLIVAAISIRRERKMRLDWGAILLAILVFGVVVGVFHGSEVLDEQKLSLGGLVWTDENSETHVLPAQMVPLAQSTQKIRITNHNGDIVVKSSDVQEITVESVVVVPRFSQVKGERVAENVQIAVQQEDVVAIDVHVETYRSRAFSLRPRVNLLLTVPAELLPDVDVTTTNGRITVQDVHVQGQLGMNSTNGLLAASGIRGNVYAEVTNGSVQLTEIHGDAKALSTNGQVKIERITGAVEATSTNGRVEIRSHLIGGNWHATTTIGAISVYLPEDGDFTLHGKVGALGSISNNLGWIQEDQREIRGVNGTGYYQVQLESSVGALSIHKQV